MTSPIEAEQTLEIPNCDVSVKLISLVQYNGKAPVTNTNVYICYTSNNYLKFEFYADDFYIKNTYTQCNENLYNQDVVEFFIANAQEDPYRHYIEFEITPYNVMFQAWITNDVKYRIWETRFFSQ